MYENERNVDGTRRYKGKTIILFDQKSRIKYTQLLHKHIYIIVVNSMKNSMDELFPCPLKCELRTNFPIALTFRNYITFRKIERERTMEKKKLKA